MVTSPALRAPDHVRGEKAGAGAVRFGLRFKAMVFAGILTSFASLLPVGFFYYEVRQTVDGELREKAITIAKSLARNSKLAVMLRDNVALDKLSADVLDSEDVLYVAIAGQAGDMITSRERQVNGKADQDGAEGLNAVRQRKLEPKSSIDLRKLQSGHSYYDVVEPVLREAGGGGGALDELEGGGAGAEAQSKTVGSVAVGVSRARAERKISSILNYSVGMFIAVFLVGMGLSWYGTKLVVLPIAELAKTAEIMASGDLTRDVEVAAGDETGVLSRAFAAMADNLKGVLRRIDEASRVAEVTVTDAGGAAGRIVSGSGRQSESVTSASAAILEMDSAIKDVARSAERMSSSVVGTTTSLEELGSSIRQIDESVTALQGVTGDASSSVLEMGANINEVAESIEDLSEQVERTATSIQEMAASIGNVDEHAGEMRGSAETASGSIEEMGKSVREVGDHAKSAFELAERAASDVAEGRQAVQSTSDGMQTIRKSFEETRRVVAGLGESSRRIGEIVDIIDDVADRTNLLSLNAAIIAAEAGEQGKAFAVVAEEIRELAVKTAASTRDIAALVRAVQAEVVRAVDRMGESDQVVMEGVQLAQKAGQALDKIQRGAQTSLEMSQLIEKATVSQLKRGEEMTREMGKLTNQALEISRATEEQARGSKAISEAVIEMRDKALMVKKAGAEQRLGGDRIAQGMEKVTAMIQQIARATREQTANAKLITDAANEMETLALEVGRAQSEQARSSAQVVTSAEVIREVTEQNTKLAEEMGQRLGALSQQMTELRQAVMGLRI